VAWNPCLGVELPRTEKDLVVPLTLAQIEAVADAIGEYYRPLVTLGAGAGLRISEALGLPILNIDWLGKQLKVRQQVVRVNRVTSIGPVKTHASLRTVPMAPVVVAELAAYLERHPRPADGLLVVDGEGQPIPENTFGQTWARAARRAGLPKGTRFHDLRHTFASALIAQGCSVKAVQVALGHESAKVTLDTYSHLWPADDDRIRAAVEGFLRGNSENLGSSRGPVGALDLQSRRSEAQKP
jgi:integrase